MANLTPHLLTTEELVVLLEERQLKLRDVSELKREELLEMYLKFALPLPQRTNSITNHRLKTTNNDTVNSLKAKYKRIESPNDLANQSIINHKRPRLTTTNAQDDQFNVRNTVNNRENLKRNFIQVTDEMADQPTSKHKKITWP